MADNSIVKQRNGSTNIILPNETIERNRQHSDPALLLNLFTRHSYFECNLLENN